MAPEVLLLLSRQDGPGYSNAVDWWSLGVTIFKMLTGKRPFNDKKFSEFMSEAMNPAAIEGFDYSDIFKRIKFPDYVSPEAQDLISKLLDVNSQTRLGAGENGIHNIKTHPFFSDIQWDLLEQKHIEPPLHPSGSMKDIPEISFQEVLKTAKRQSFDALVPSEDLQSYFSDW